MPASCTVECFRHFEDQRLPFCVSHMMTPSLRKGRIRMADIHCIAIGQRLEFFVLDVG